LTPSSHADDEDAIRDPTGHKALFDELRLEATIVTTDSPYAEVRAVVDNHDDASIACSTIRAWVIGMAMSVLLPFVNALFAVHKPAINLNVYIAQLLGYLLGKLWERSLPNIKIPMPLTKNVRLNPGPFTKKEHMFITIMANSARVTPYSLDIVYVQFLPNFLNQSWAGNFGYQALGALATNFVGYGMAGLIRRFLVYPALCIWPQALVIIALNSALHEHSTTDEEGKSSEAGAIRGPFGSLWRVSRTRFFLIAFAAMFVWYFFPGYIFTALSTFSWLTWIAPNDLNLDIITGMNSGLGLNPLSTFDWNVVMSEGDPLVIPLFGTLNRFAGVLITFPVVAALWYKNVFFSGYLPIVANSVFDNTGATYNISRATDAHGIFDEAKFRAYSPAYMGAGNAVSYMMLFAIYPATLVYVLLNHWAALKATFSTSWNSAFRKRRSNGKHAPADAGPITDVH
jgi:OPT family small oligopeptide transporter